MSNYFEVGEEVILQSKALPERNGQTFTIEKVFCQGPAKITCRITGEIIRYQVEGFGYRLCDPFTRPDRHYETLFKESALRKKHNPSPQSFTGLMEDLLTRKVI